MLTAKSHKLLNWAKENVQILVFGALICQYVGADLANYAAAILLFILNYMRLPFELCNFLVDTKFGHKFMKIFDMLNMIFYIKVSMK